MPLFHPKQTESCAISMGAIELLFTILKNQEKIMVEFDNLTKAVTDAIAEMVAVEAKLAAHAANAVVAADVQALADKLVAASAALTTAAA